MFLHGDYGSENNHGSSIFSFITEPNGHQWYVKAGIRHKWTGLGATILYGEAMEYVDEIGPAALNAGVSSSDFTRWGLGVAQEIDKAAMTLWLKYRQHDGEITGAPFNGGLDDFQYVSAGGLIYF